MPGLFLEGYDVAPLLQKGVAFTLAIQVFQTIPTPKIMSLCSWHVY